MSHHDPAPTGPAAAGGGGEVPGIALGRELGHGGFATVYLGRDVVVGREVAVKIDRRALVDESDRRRFNREVTAAGQVSAHPNIVTLLSGGITSGNRPYLVMELCPGGSLGDRLARGPLPAAEVLGVGIAIADALAAAHAVGILHRDVKPANILVTAFGAPALADFGLASLPAEWELPTMSRHALTPSFAAPETFTRNASSVQADVYSLGATLYALLVGRPPRWTEAGPPPLGALIAGAHTPLPPLDVPDLPALTDVIARATAPEPADRTPSAAALRDELLAVAGGRLTADLRRYAPAIGAAGPAAAAAAAPATIVDPAARAALPEPRTLSLGPPAPPPVQAAGSKPDRTAVLPAHEVGGPGGFATTTPGGSVLVPVVPASPAQPPRRRVRKAAIAGTCLAVVLAAGGLGYAALHDSGPNRAATSAQDDATDKDRSDDARATTGHGTGAGAATSSGRADAGRSHQSTGNRGAGDQAQGNPSSDGSPDDPAARTPSNGPVDPTLLPSAGTCWGGIVRIAGQAPVAKQVNCSDEHYWEAFAVGTLDPATDYSRDASIQSDPVVLRTCTRATLGAYLGNVPSIVAEITALGPTEHDVDLGSRAFVCLTDQGKQF